MTPVDLVDERVRAMREVLKVFADANWPDTTAGNAAAAVFSDFPTLVNYMRIGAMEVQSLLPHFVKVGRPGSKARPRVKKFDNLHHAINWVADKTGKASVSIKDEWIIDPRAPVIQDDGDQTEYRFEVIL